MTPETEVYYVGRRDPLTWALTTDGGDLPSTFYLTVTRVVLFVGEVKIDTDENAEAINWKDGHLAIHLDLAPPIPAGRHETRLIVYTQFNDKGGEDWRFVPMIRVVDSALR